MDKLIAQYEKAVRAYRLAAMALIDKHGDDFINQVKEADRLRILAREAYQRIAQHDAEHGCGQDVTSRVAD